MTICVASQQNIGRASSNQAKPDIILIYSML